MTAKKKVDDEAGDAAEVVDGRRGRHDRRRPAEVRPPG